jgi:hypothetical protein
LRVTNVGRIETIQRITIINEKAKDWEDEGFEVKANIGGWDHPSAIEGLTPDLRGKRGDDIRIGCVEFEDEIEGSVSKWDKLVAYSGQNKNASFRLYSINKDGICNLWKAFP